MVVCDAIPFPNYCPGYLPQDWITLPMEAAVVAGISLGTHASESPRWPFARESAEGERNPSRQPSVLAVGLGVAVLVPLTAKLSSDGKGFDLWRHVRGLAHSHLLTETVTVGAKKWFGRKRPFYDTVQRRGEAHEDDRMSFFSGHASHSFAFATYTTVLGHTYLDDSVTKWAFTGLLYGMSGWMSASRAVDGQHNWSDVLVGATVGSGIAYFVAERVVGLGSESLSMSATPGQLHIGYVF